MLTENARAKINLTLRVLGRREDGYHVLESLVSFADVADEVSLRVGVPAAVTADGDFASAIDGENLLARTLAELRGEAARLALGAVHLTKRLPVAAGLGGGSADAAALLRLVQRANLDTADAAAIDWRTIAARLGADVPVCLANAPALMWGIGERLLPLPPAPGAPPALPAVLVNPGMPLATRDVFRALAASKLDLPAATPSAPMLATAADLVAYMRATGNDLQGPALRLLPRIGEIQAALRAQAGCLHAALSGSGPTCYALFATAGDAEAARAAIARARPGWWVVATRIDFPAGGDGVSSPG